MDIDVEGDSTIFNNFLAANREWCEPEKSWKIGRSPWSSKLKPVKRVSFGELFTLRMVLRGW